MSFGHPVKLPMPRILQGDYSSSNHSLVYIPMESGSDAANNFRVDDDQPVHSSSPSKVKSRSSTPSTARQSIDSDSQLAYQRITSRNLVDIDDSLDNNVAEVNELLKDMADSYGDNDQVQHTVTSFGGLSIDTQDSARYEDAPFPCGNIQFYHHHPQTDVEPKRHYVCIPLDNSSEEVTRFMGSYWKMRSPKIVLSVISGVKHFRAWKNQRLKEQFQKGIIKAANTTEMWIITSGVDGGVSKMIGDAVREEKARRASNRSHMSKIKPEQVQKFQKLTLIGVLPKDGIKYGDLLDGSEGVMIKNEGHAPKSDKYELNPDHTHFVIVDEEDIDRMFFTNIRCTLEKEFEIHLGRPRRLRRVFSWGSDESSQDLKYDPPVQKTIPVIGLLVQGSPKGLDHVLFYLKNKMPVVVLKGSGGLADLIAYAYEELQERTDPDFEETFLKPELLKQVYKTYPADFQDNDLARNEFRDKILECVGLASEDDQIFLTILNMQGWDANLKDLDKYLLKALFKSEKQSVSKWKEQLHKDLQLLLDWNRPDLARSEIFQRDDFSKIKLNKELLEQALLKQDREEFVRIFLDQGVQVHKFLNHKKFMLLFERAEEREFFTTICLEGALGLTEVSDLPLENNFLATDLNRLIYKLAGIKDFVQPYELSMNSVGLYVLDPAVAERKALNCLTIWAVLMNRHKLAKVLWQRCDEPIALALICSNIYLELSKFCIELYLRTEMEDNAKMLHSLFCLFVMQSYLPFGDFGQIALGVLDISFRDSSAQAYSILSTPLSDFGNKTTIEIAHNASNLNFIAHPCCQKWLTKKLYGSIQVKELHFGVFRLPYWLKILASVFLVFPMYLWISFLPSARTRKKRKGISVNENVLMEEDDDDDDSDSNNEEEDLQIPSSKSMLENELKMRKKSMTVRIKSALKTKKIRKVPLWKQIYLLWSAPITKFWLTQMFYFIYLGIFCLAVLWPTCGNLYLDLVVWMWTAVILTELVRRTYVKHQKYKAFSLFAHCVEIGLIMVFLILYLFLRLMPYWLNYADINAAKTVLSVGLIYFFYRLLGTYLPISPTLGPMLVRMTRMVKHDFVAFIRMFLIFLISGGVTIQAVLYPNYPLSIDLIKRVLTRPLFAMFLTKIDDLDGRADCHALYSNVTPSFCVADNVWSGSTASSDPKIVPLQHCPYPSLGGYLIVIQYLLICKLVLVTLLFAMFALTITKVDTQASEIWKFQRYALIVDFEEKLILPPPLTLISYAIMVCKLIHRKVCGCCKRCRTVCCCRQESKRTDDEKMVYRVQRIKRSEDYNYWKKCAREYITVQDSQLKKQQMEFKQTEIINTIEDDMRQQKKNMRRMNNRIVELERIMLSSKMYLENIFHKLDKTDVLGIQNIKGQIIHVAARQSPYPGTRFARFPVFDKYVPWEQVYDVYDPKIYTKPKEQFAEDEIIFVDEDLIQLKKLKDERDLMTDEEKEELPPLPHLSPVWNSVVSYRVESNTRALDRRSWISYDNQPLRYELDPIGLPLNPMGRTGIRGKGVLWRWGPNHVIKAVSTRWRRKYSDTGAHMGFLYVEGKRVLEFIAVKKVGEGDMESIYGLPGGALHGHISPYSTLCESFTKGVLDDTESGTSAYLDQSDMIQFFAQFASQNVNQKSSFSLASPVPSSSQSIQSRTGSRTSLRTETDSQGFCASLLYKGYVDDPRNTDNAWVEAEVWNFHYDLGDTFDVRIPEDSTAAWKEVSPNVKIFGNEGAIVQEAARIHDAYH